MCRRAAQPARFPHRGMVRAGRVRRAGRAAKPRGAGPGLSPRLRTAGMLMLLIVWPGELGFLSLWPERAAGRRARRGGAQAARAEPGAGPGAAAAARCP